MAFKTDVIMNRYDKNGLPEYCAVRSISRNSNPPAEVFVHSWNIPEHDYRIRVLHASDLSLLNFNNLQTIVSQIDFLNICSEVYSISMFFSLILNVIFL